MSDLFTLLKGKLHTVEVGGEKLWIAEGDTLLNEEQLKEFAETREKLMAESDPAKRDAVASSMGMARTGTDRHALIAMSKNGKVVKWKAGTVLTYRVAKDSFGGNAAHYKMVVDAMTAATGEWQKACGIKFQYRADLDSKPGTGPEGLKFVVKETDVGGKFIAAAFFPSDPVARRIVNVDPSFYTTSFDKVGVMRHELGHVLGFRHEHISNSAPSSCPNEPLADTFPVTPYDPKSVMHYFCGGHGTNILAITDLDRKGAQQVYGPPLA
jgi:hypothetical protein